MRRWEIRDDEREATIYDILYTIYDILLAVC